jgi:hypothetical protein
MYQNTGDDMKVTLPVHFNSKFLIGPEGAHLNISGISGLAAKTSYAMFLLKAIQDRYTKLPDNDDSVAFVMFNVKGKDLMAIDQPNDFADDPDGLSPDEAKARVFELYQVLGIRPEPFKDVKYYVPKGEPGQIAHNTCLGEDMLKDYINLKKAKQYVFNYADDKDNLDLFFSNIDDTNQTIDAIQEYIINGQGDFDKVNDWQGFTKKVGEHCQAGSQKGTREIPVVSWRKFKRIVTKALNHGIFARRTEEDATVRLEDALKNIKPNEVHVVDIANLSEIMQAFVFGYVVRTILRHGEYDDENDNPPKRIIIFIDELNKYASSDAPKNSPILRQILDVTERGRSQGVILFAAEQFRSAIHDRVKGNCATHAYGRTNSIETAKSDYKVVPNTYKSILTRLEPGEYLLQNPIFRSMLRIKFPKPIYKQFKN